MWRNGRPWRRWNLRKPEMLARVCVGNSTFFKCKGAKVSAPVQIASRGSGLPRQEIRWGNAESAGKLADCANPRSLVPLFNSIHSRFCYAGLFSEFCLRQESTEPKGFESFRIEFQLAPPICSLIVPS